jgi:TRAP-type C4-dicarboxylate transport system substrate-binding protein
MYYLKHCLIALAMVAAGAVFAKLPAPSPEEQAAAAAKKAQKEIQMKKEAEALEKAQDRVAKRYRKEQAASGARTPRGDMPKTTGELPRGVGPTPDSPASAEAHSGKNK